jgi:hypothetical protein
MSRKKKPGITTLHRFSTGLHTSDWHRYPAPPCRGQGWTVDCVEQKSKFPLGGERVGERLYPSREVILSARSQTAAQRALDTIRIRNAFLAAGSRFFQRLTTHH